MPQLKKGEGTSGGGSHLIDTNVILRFLIGDDPSKAARAASLMGRVERGEETIEIAEEVLAETVWTLESYYRVPRAEIAQRLAAIASFTGVRVASREELVRSLQSYASTNADFVDCLIAARSKHRKIPVYTFDESDFKKLDADWEKP